jgi:WhiB family transcriptional regulator, redox-sensing transcriptional regulator
MTYAGGGLMTVPIRGEVGEVLPCRQVDPELFFAEAPADVEAAKALCRDCPIQEACLAGALERREPWGVWGGQLFIGGVVVARKRPRGRPRKYPLPEPFAPAAGSEGTEAAA